TPNRIHSPLGDKRFEGIVRSRTAGTRTGNRADYSGSESDYASWCLSQNYAKLFFIAGRIPRPLEINPQAIADACAFQHLATRRLFPFVLTIAGFRRSGIPFESRHDVKNFRRSRTRGVQHFESGLGNFRRDLLLRMQSPRGVRIAISRNVLL